VDNIEAKKDFFLIFREKTIFPSVVNLWLTLEQNRGKMEIDGKLWKSVG